MNIKKVLLLKQNISLARNMCHLHSNRTGTFKNYIKVKRKIAKFEIFYQTLDLRILLICIDCKFGREFKRFNSLLNIG